MPKIPTVPVGGFNDARGALVAPGQSQTTPALSAFADMANQELEDQSKRRDLVRSVQLKEQFKRRIAQQTQDLDPMAPGYRETLNSMVDDSLKEFGATAESEIGDPDVLTNLTANITQIGEGAKTTAVVFRRQEIEKEAIRVRGEAENSTLADIRDDPDGYAGYLQAFGADAQNLNVSIGAEKLPKMNEQFADMAIYAAAEGLAMQGRYDEARGFIDDNEAALGPKAFRAAKGRIREIEIKNLQEHLTNTAEKVASIAIDITDANDVSEIDGIRKTIDAEADQGLFVGREQKKAALIAAAEERRRSIIKGQKDLTTAMALYNAGLGLNTQKQADALWQHHAKALQDASPQQLMDHVVQFAAHGGRLPTQFKGLIGNAERTENPTLLATAARLDDQIKSKAPNVDTDAKERVHLVSAYHELAGVPYKDAAQMVLDKVPNAAVLKERGEKFKEDFADFDARKTLQGQDLAGGNIAYHLSAGIFGTEDDISAKAARDYERMVRLHYNLSGDKDIALKAAGRNFRQRYGRSTVSGKARVVEFPPERYFPGSTNQYLRPDQKASILKAEIGRYLKANKLTPGTTVVGEDEAVPAYDLVADETTQKDIASGQAPSYQLRVRQSLGDVGVLIPVPGKDGKPVRYRMPTMEQLVEIPEYQKIVTDERARSARPTTKPQPQAEALQRMEDREEDVAARNRALAEALRPPANLKEFRERWQKIFGR